jgi:hypothetical protein
VLAQPIRTAPSESNAAQKLRRQSFHWNKHPVDLAVLLKFRRYSIRQKGYVVTATERFPGNFVIYPTLTITFNDIFRNNTELHNQLSYEFQPDAHKLTLATMKISPS